MSLRRSAVLTETMIHYADISLESCQAGRDHAHVTSAPRGPEGAPPFVPAPIT
jgi:hypothetical protein